MSIPERIIHEEHIIPPQFKHCPICEPDFFSGEVEQMTTYNLLDWFDQLVDNCDGSKNFYTDKGSLCLEYELTHQAAVVAEIVLKSLRVKFSLRANSIELQLKPGWNGRFELEK